MTERERITLLIAALTPPAVLADEGKSVHQAAWEVGQIAHDIAGRCADLETAVTRLLQLVAR